MAETLLVDAATVLAGASTTVEAFAPAVPNPQFRVACNQIHSVRFYVADADFSVITAAAIIPAYTVTAVASTTGTLGNVYTIDLGAYDYVAAVATNNSAFSSVVSIAAGYDLVAEAPSALFTVAEARLHDKAQLASATDFPNAVIITEEAKIRTLFLGACGRDFFPTVHTDEYQDGYGMSSIMLDWPLVMAVSAASIRSDTTWTPLTVAELAQLQPLDTGELYWDGGTWPSGRRNVKVTYTAGYATVPPLIHERLRRQSNSVAKQYHRLRQVCACIRP